MLGIKALMWDPDLNLPVSPLQGTPWTSNRMTGTCTPEGPEGKDAYLHTAPDPDCNCGIHALRAFFWLSEYTGNEIPYLTNDLFTCLLEASGKIILHDYGWRSEIVTVLGVGPSPGLFPIEQPGMMATKYFGVPFYTLDEIISELGKYPYLRFEEEQRNLLKIRRLPDPSVCPY